MRRGRLPPQHMGVMVRRDACPPPCKPTAHRWRWEQGDEWRCRRCGQERCYGEVRMDLGLPRK